MLRVTLEGAEHAMLAAQADACEVNAFADFFDAAPADVRRKLGLSVHHVADATLLLAPGIDSPLLNRAIGFGNHLRMQPCDVVEITRRYADAGVANWWLHVNLGTLPLPIQSEIRSRGFSPAHHAVWAKMHRTRGPVAEVGTEFEVVRASATQLDAAAEIIRAAFDLPPVMAPWLKALHERPGWQTFAALDGRDVVGCGCLYLRRSAAWLGMGAVAASARRRGAHAALLLHRVAAALAAGATHLYTEAGEPADGVSNSSLNNMRRVGFSKLASRLNLSRAHSPIKRR